MQFYRMQKGFVAIDFVFVGNPMKATFTGSFPFHIE